MIRRWLDRRRSAKGDGYQPIGDSVSWDIALSQAVTALDHAAKLSIATRSPNGMREVAVGWLAVAQTLEAASESGEENDISSQEEDYPKVGFIGAPMSTRPEAEEFDDEEDDPMSGRRSRQFKVNRQPR